MKYDFDIDLETKNSLSIIINRIKPNSMVLEFGPANGRMTRYLKEVLNCKVYAVEIDKEAAKDAKRYCEKILVDDVEKYTWLEVYKDLEFDYIVFADVLEHLYYPEKVLKESKLLLKDDGSVLMSLPNIAHNAIIMELLNDEFTYRDTGLLDNTHIRFFTKNTLENLIVESGLEIQYETASYASPMITEFQHTYSDLSDEVGKQLQNREFGEVYQFIFEAKKKAIKKVIDFEKLDVVSLYYDTGSGFNESEKYSLELSIDKEKKFIFDCRSTNAKIKAIRIDPLEHSISIKVKSLKVDDVEYSQYLTHNGTNKDDGTISFLSHDPQFLVSFDNGVVIKNVSLEYEFISKIYNEKDQQIQEFIKAIDDKEVHIQNQNNEITHLHHVAQSLRLKNRLKRIIKIFIPNKLWKILRYIKHNPNAIKLGLHILKTQGIKALLSKVNKVEALSEERIENTYTYIEPKYSTEVEQTINEFKKKPLISIIMPVYNVDPKWLELAIESIKNQWYENWELCIVDDKSTNKKTLDYLKNIKHKKIKIKFLENNLNISGASNEALKLVSGEYVALMDNDDEITPNALYEVVKVINETGSEFVYSDEDKLEVNGIFSDPHFKPDFAPDMFLSQNYMSHFGVIKKELIDKVDGFTIGLEGAQDYDLYLKVLEHTDKIYHIQKVLYHWRKIPGSTASEFGEKSYAQEAGRKALENAMNRRKIDAIVINGLTAGTYKVEYKIIGTPLVSIIIPFKDRPDLLTMCIESILNKSTYKNFEIIGISNNSEENKTFKEMKRLESLDDRIKFHEYNVPFNYSDINNHAVEKYADGEHLLFLNNDIEVITPKWIEELLMHSQREVVGAVGAKLYFPDNTIQHAGLAIAPYTMHSVIIMYSRHSRDEYGYVSRAKCINNYSAVTAACMMIKKNIFIQFNGFDSEKLKIAYNDVDLCLTMIENNKQNIFTPYCELYHYESVSRGYETKRIDKERAEKEKYYLKEKHSVFYKKDKFYNPNLSLYGVDSSFNLSNSIHYKALVGLPFEEKIILKEKINTKRKNRVCIFSHFDKNNIVNKYVLYYLSELSKVSDIIFVSTSEGLQNTDSLKLYCRDIIVKENYGYDFGAWKSGLNLLGNELEDYEELILCNDSMFGPFYELEPIFNKMSNSYDVWSMTDNMQIAHHLQSFFVVYNKKAFQHKLFKDFWNNFKIYIDKQKLIEMNEIKFSEELLKCKDLRVGSYVEARELDSFLNITHYYWDELLSKYKFPFIKKELLRDNPMNLDTSNWKEVIESTSDYNTKLIIDVLEKS